MAKNKGQIVLGLDTPRTVSQINADIKKLQNQLKQVKAIGALDTDPTVKKINAQINALQSQLKTININAKIDTNSTIKTAQQTVQQIGQTVADAAQKTINDKNINIDILNADIKTLVNNLNSFSSKNAGFDSFKTVINGVEVSLDSLISKLSTVDNTTDLSTIRSQTAALKTAFTELSQINTIQLLLNGGIENDYSTQIAKIEGNFRSLGLTEDEIQKKTSNITNTFNELKNQPFDKSNYQEIISLNDKLQKELAESSNEYIRLQASAKGYVSAQQRLSKASVIEAWNLKNRNATREARSANEAYITSLRNLNVEMTSVKFSEISDGFSRIKNSMTTYGKISTAVKNQILQARLSLISFMSLSHVVMKAVSWFTQMPSKVITLDTALVDLKRTAKMNAQDLENFYYVSNDVAKQMGVTTEEILKQASAWSRLGFNTAEQATQMTKLSSQFALISPGLSVDDATSGLVSIMKAYDVSVSDVLDGIESKINIIGNNLDLSNANIVKMLQDSVSAMAEGRNTLEETIALESAAYEIIQNEDVDNGFKTVALRLRGMNEETEELDESLKTIKGDLYELTGVSIMEDTNTYKSTYQILKEISKVWDSLTDTTRTEALELMFGKQRSDIGAAVLKNFEAAENAMDLMANSAGNANAELSVAMDSIEYKMNRLSETGTSVAQNLFKRDDMKTVVDGLTSVMNVIDKLTSKLGLFGSIGMGAGLFAGFKNIGKCRISVRIS